jgi:hypothetical protein
MKSEGLILNIICLLLAAVFVGLAVLSFTSAGSFLTIDSLFFTAVCALLALVFIVNPLMTIKEGRLLAASSSGREEQVAEADVWGATSAVATPSSKSSTASKSSRVKRDPRALPPDVEKMVAQMNKPGPENS